jgi:hypothetical protein
MGNPHQIFWQEIGQFFGKWFSYILLTAAGVIARLTFNVRDKKLSRWQIISCAIIGSIVGSITGFWCVKTGHDNLGIFLVPAVSIGGQEIVSFIVLNSNKILLRITNFFPLGGKNGNDTNGK